MRVTGIKEDFKRPRNSKSPRVMAIYQCCHVIKKSGLMIFQERRTRSPYRSAPDERAEQMTTPKPFTIVISGQEGIGKSELLDTWIPQRYGDKDPLKPNKKTCKTEHLQLVHLDDELRRFQKNKNPLVAIQNHLRDLVKKAHKAGKSVVFEGQTFGRNEAKKTLGKDFFLKVDKLPGEHHKFFLLRPSNPEDWESNLEKQSAVDRPEGKRKWLDIVQLLLESEGYEEPYFPEGRDTGFIEVPNPQSRHTDPKRKGQMHTEIYNHLKEILDPFCKASKKRKPRKGPMGAEGKQEVMSEGEGEGEGEGKEEGESKGEEEDEAARLREQKVEEDAERERKRQERERKAEEKERKRRRKEELQKEKERKKQLEKKYPIPPAATPPEKKTGKKKKGGGSSLLGPVKILSPSAIQLHRKQLVSWVGKGDPKAAAIIQDAVEHCSFLNQGQLLACSVVALYHMLEFHGVSLNSLPKWNQVYEAVKTSTGAVHNEEMIQYLSPLLPKAFRLSGIDVNPHSSATEKEMLLRRLLSKHGPLVASTYWNEEMNHTVLLLTITRDNKCVYLETHGSSYAKGGLNSCSLEVMLESLEGIIHTIHHLRGLIRDRHPKVVATSSS